MKLYVGNLAFETTENDLQDLFEQHGTVNEVNLMIQTYPREERARHPNTERPSSEARLKIYF